MRLILDNNVVSLLCCGVARRIACSARQSAQSVLMHSSLPLLEELTNVRVVPFVYNRWRSLGSWRNCSSPDYSSVVELVEPAAITPTSRDPDDDVVLATALSAGAHIIVSGDRDLLDLTEYEGIHIVTAAQAVTMMVG